jgi:hypothetical protein
MNSFIVKTNSVSNSLRELANEIEATDTPIDMCTVVLGTKVYHIGNTRLFGPRVDALFNLTYALSIADNTNA